MTSQRETRRDSERPDAATQSATRLLPADPRLIAINEAWDRLPEAIQAGIMAMVKADDAGTHAARHTTTKGSLR